MSFRRVLSFFFPPMVVTGEFYTYCDWLLVEVGSGFEVVVVIKFFLFVVVTGEFQREREISEKEIEEKASEF